MSQKIFTITINFNGKQNTINCLKSLNKIKLPKNISHQVILIDNASHGDDVQVIKKEFPNLQMINNQENTGFAQGNNLGIRSALKQGADFVIILNNDTEVDPDFINHFLGAVKRHPLGGIFSPKILFAPGKEFHKSRYQKSDIGKVIWSAGGKIDWSNMFGVNIGLDEVDQGQFDQEKLIEMASGCCMLLTRTALDQLQGFDERYFMYYEDVDLCLRAQKAGLEIWYTPQSKILHVSSASVVIGSVLSDYFVARNRMLAGLHYAPIRTKLALIKESIRLFFY